ncbi:chorismate synthase [Thiovulum sp. ES]|nr:chorismate synthase [Thiovulum sp. ES]
MNRFGERFSFTTFGESHGIGVGVVVDGVPAGLELNEEIIQKDLDRRKPGGQYATSRKESDEVEILSGVFEGKTTGTPIGMLIRNKNQKSKDYSNVKDLFRPGHADFTYFHKYENRDYRGGGRSSARETASRVMAGAVAGEILKQFGIEVCSGVSFVGGVGSDEYDFEFAKKSEIYSLSPEFEEEQKQTILSVREHHDSLGGTAVVKIKNSPIGLGEPIYYKLDAKFADAMLSINGTKGVEIGLGAEATKKQGSENNDEINENGFQSNNSGGILGGISNGDDIDIKIHFKPTPSIFKTQDTIDIHGDPQKMNLKGRHDPAIVTRGSVVAEAMAKIVLVDMLLLNMGRKMSDFVKYYR